MARRAPSRSYIFQGAGGAMDGAYVLEYLLWICKYTGMEPHELFDFFIGESISSLFTAALTTRHPDHENRAIRSVQGLTDHFYDHTEDLLPYRGWNGLRSVLFGGTKRYLKRKPLKQELKDVFGKARMSDALKGSIITSQRLIPAPRQAHNFTHIPDDLFAGAHFPMPDTMVESSDVKVFQACLASMAHAYFSKSYTVPSTGTVHSDFGSIGNRAPEVLYIAGRMQASGLQPTFCRFGTGLSDAVQNHDDIKKIDRSGLFSLRMAAFAQEGGKAEARYAELETLKLTLGKDNIHLFEMDMNNPPEGVEFPTNLLDSRPKAMKQRREAAAAFIRANFGYFTQFGDEIGENSVLRRQFERDDTTARLPAQSIILPTQPNGTSGAGQAAPELLH